MPSSRRFLSALLIVVGVLASAGSAHAAGGVYVALGDSYTSAPLVPMQYGEPIDCGRSDHNYPSLVAQGLRVKTFIDVSCGSAQTKHMTEPQTDLPLGGTNPPQFNALRPDATLVTVGIGGNDAGLVGVAEKCAELGATNPNGTACRDYWAPNGNDQVAARIEATKPKIAGVLRGIQRRSPRARVAIVGYPDVLPDQGNCYPMVPLSSDDIRYIDELIRRINAMIAGQAAATGAEFIDTYRDSGGHDVCTLPPTRWFEGLVPTEPAYPLHPNGKGEASMARSALAVLSRPRRGAPRRGNGTPGSASCLARRSSIGIANIGRIRLGYRRQMLLERVRVRPARRTARAFAYCTRGGAGRVAAVFASRSPRARVQLVVSTARGHGNRRVRPGSRRAALARAYPNRVRIGRGLVRASRRSRLVFGLRRGRVRFVGVAGDRALRSPRRLARGVRLARR